MWKILSSFSQHERTQKSAAPSAIYLFHFLSFYIIFFSFSLQHELFPVILLYGVELDSARDAHPAVPHLC